MDALGRENSGKYTKQTLCKIQITQRDKWHNYKWCVVQTKELVNGYSEQVGLFGRGQVWLQT